MVTKGCDDQTDDPEFLIPSSSSVRQSVTRCNNNRSCAAWSHPGQPDRVNNRALIWPRHPARDSYCVINKPAVVSTIGRIHSLGCVRAAKPNKVQINLRPLLVPRKTCRRWCIFQMHKGVSSDAWSDELIKLLHCQALWLVGCNRDRLTSKPVKLGHMFAVEYCIWDVTWELGQGDLGSYARLLQSNSWLVSAFDRGPVEEVVIVVPARFQIRTDDHVCLGFLS
jgi:hypothetical protein